MKAGAPQRKLISKLAGRLVDIRPVTAAQVSLLGFMVGALHALDRAAQLNYDDARGKPDRDRSASEFRLAVRAVARGGARSNQWLAGFYLDSALMRLAALNTRLNKLLGTNDDRVRDVRQIANSLKHDVDAHVGRPWTLRFGDAIVAAKILIDRLLIAMP